MGTAPLRGGAAAAHPVPIDLIGARTGNCIRVAIALEEASLPYKVAVLDLKNGEHRSPAHLALNPEGKVPYIIDRSSGTDVVLSQSNAILFHASRRSPGRLLPLDDAPRTMALERFFYFLTDVIAVNHAAFFLRLRGQPDASLVLDRKSHAAIGHSERFVQESRYMGGDQFTLADIAAYTIVATCHEEIDWRAAPNLERWFAELRERPSMKRGMHAFDGGGA